MATIKSYTDLEQSKKLAEILPLESADMEYMFLKKDGSKVADVPFVKDGSEESDCCYNFIPCWSLAALLELIEMPTLLNDSIGRGKTGWMVMHYDVNGMRYDSNYFDIPVDACYEMILKLHELKML